MSSQWEVIYDDVFDLPVGTVLWERNQEGEFCAYRALPVCPGLNWDGTYPNKVYRLFDDRERAIAWVKGEADE